MSSLEKRVAYIALGSNLPTAFGTPEQTIRAAMARLGEMGRLTAQSSLYETDPAGYHAQPAFLNAVAALETQLEPLQLLHRLLALEREFGRERDLALPKGPRTLDLDLLLLDGFIIVSAPLTLPHPAMAQRRFVLQPLAEIAPRLEHPLLHRSISTLLEELADEGDNRVSAVRRAQDRDQGSRPTTVPLTR